MSKLQELNNLRFFSEKDNFGGLANMDRQYLRILDIARYVIKQACIIHCGYSPSSSAHVRYSVHKENPCRASDEHYSNKTVQSYKINSLDLERLHLNLDKLVLHQKKRTILEIILLQKLSGIKRIGVYPFGKPRTYFHTDIVKTGNTDFWIGLHVDGLLKRLKVIFPKYEQDINSLYDKIKKDGESKKILYIYPK